MIDVREAMLDDLHAILEIYNEAVRNLAATFDIEEQTLEQRKAWFMKFGEKYPLLVADRNGDIAGYCCLSPFMEKAAYSKTTELSVYISSRYRGQKIGYTLVQHVMKRASELGFHTIVSRITGDNEASVNLHLKFGFEHVGRLQEVGYKFGKWHDVHFYQKMLKDQDSPDCR